MASNLDFYREAITNLTKIKDIISQYSPNNKDYINDKIDETIRDYSTYVISTNVINYYSEKEPRYYDSIQFLSLDKVDIYRIPDWVSQCKNLKCICIRNTNISKIENLPPNLEQLFLTNNKIAEIDYTVFPQSLRTLSVTSNNNLIKTIDIAKIPKSITYCNIENFTFDAEKND